MILYIFTTIGVIALLAWIGFGAYCLYKKLTGQVQKTHDLAIYGDAVTSMHEEILFYIIDNVDKHEAFWNADLGEIKLYASGREISSKAFKAEDLKGAIRIMVTGMMNSTIDMMLIIGATKYDIWEISFDGGATRLPLHQKDDKFQRVQAEKAARKNGWQQLEHEKKISKQIEKDFKKSNKYKITSGAKPKHGLVAHINEGKSTGTSLRYQILVPAGDPILEFIDNNRNSGRFYHIYEGVAYEIESHFVDKVGSLYEYDLVGLEPGKIYVGLSTSVNEGKTIMPSSALYGITKNHKGEVPTVDDAELAKPVPGAKPHKIWNEELAHGYLGEELTEKMYSIIVKKHYEDEYTEDYLSLSRAQDFYADYNWLKGDQRTKEEDIHVVKHLVRVKEEIEEGKIKPLEDEEQE